MYRHFIYRPLSAIMLSSLFLFLLLSRLQSTVPSGITSSGAPPSSTGAPGEKDCTQSGCHDDAKNNVGPAACLVEIPGLQSGYQPDSIYTIKVSIRDSSRHRFGYQLVVLDSIGRNAGEFSILEPTRTQILQNLNEMQDRRYATYTFAGTAESSSGYDQWTIQWKAPSAELGPLSIYTAFVSANNDKTDKGDQMYTRSTTLYPATSGCISTSSEDAAMVYPHPVKDRLYLSRVSGVEDLQSIEIIDARAQVVRSIQSVDGQWQDADLRDLSAGSYFLVLHRINAVSSIHFIKD